MYIKNERGMSLLDITVALAILVLVLALGYKILTYTIVQSQNEIIETTEILQTDSYNRLFLEDIRDAKAFTYTETNGTIKITYTTTKAKELTFNRIGEGLYSLDYKDTKANKVDLLQLTTVPNTLPLTFDTTKNALTLNHKLGNIAYNYTIHLRRDIP